MTESLIDTAQVQIVWGSLMSTIKWGSLTPAQLTFLSELYTIVYRIYANTTVDKKNNFKIQIRFIEIPGNEFLPLNYCRSITVDLSL